MASTENKVKFGLKNVHYALITSDTGGTAVFGTPVPMPGAVSLTMDPEGEVNEFYADNGAYYVSYGTGGYSGTLEIANILNDFRRDVMGETEDIAAGTLTENAADEAKPFALLFEFWGDKTATKYVLYNCTASRPSVTGSTTTKTKEPTPESLSIKASPLSNGNIKTMTTGGDGTSYEGWYTEVWQPAPKV